MEQNPRYDEIERYGSLFWSLIEKSFEVKLQNMSTSAPSLLHGPIDFNARFPFRNNILKGTSYYYDQSQKLIHFTSLPKLLSIINEGSLRMYNLYNSNDLEEYTFAGELFKGIYKIQGFPEDWIQREISQRKEKSFITSCTTIDSLKSPNFWEEYSDKKKGVAIEFEVLNSLDSWEGFYLSNVHYDKLEEFESLISEWTKLQLQNQNILYRIKLDQILSLHKSKDWIEEKEIRLLTLYPDLYENYFKEFLYQDIKSNCPPKNKIEYFKLPLCNKEGNFINSQNNDLNYFLEILPKIKISDIFFGPDFETEDDFYSFQKDLKYYICKKMNCFLINLPKERTITE